MHASIQPFPGRCVCQNAGIYDEILRAKRRANQQCKCLVGIKFVFNVCIHKTKKKKQLKETFLDVFGRGLAGFLYI